MTLPITNDTQQQEMKKYTKPQLYVTEFTCEPLMQSSPLSYHNSVGDNDVEYVKKEGGTSASTTDSNGSLWDENW